MPVPGTHAVPTGDFRVVDLNAANRFIYTGFSNALTHCQAILIYNTSRQRAFLYHRSSGENDTAALTAVAQDATLAAGPVDIVIIGSLAGETPRIFQAIMGTFGNRDGCNEYRTSVTTQTTYRAAICASSTGYVVYRREPGQENLGKWGVAGSRQWPFAETDVDLFGIASEIVHRI